MGDILEQATEKDTTLDREWFSGREYSPGTDYIKYFNDFTRDTDYAAADWVITTVEFAGGDATEALTNLEGGALLITNHTRDDDSDSFQQAGAGAALEAFKLQKDKKLWYETRIQTNDATQTDIFVGLCIVDTTPLVASDRCGFQKDDGVTTIRCLTEKNSAETSKDSGKDLANDTYVKLAMRWDGVKTIDFFVDRVKVRSVDTDIPNDEELSLTMMIQNGAAAAKTMTIDYIYCVQER